MCSPFEDGIVNGTEFYRFNIRFFHVLARGITRKLAKLILTLLTLPLLVVVWLLKWFVMFLYCCSAWIFYLLGSVLFATAVLSFLMKQSQGMEALQMLIGGFVIFMIPQVVGSVAVFWNWWQQRFGKYGTYKER